MNWDDLRYVLALSRAGSLAKAAKKLGVDHTTVGRRIEALEGDLGVRLFTRSTTGYVLTQEAERILPEIQDVEDAVLKLERCSASGQSSLEGAVRVTSSETFGSLYLAPRLARFGAQNPGLVVELMIGHAIFDLARREADVAVRFFKSTHEHLVLAKAGELGFAIYGTQEYFTRHPFPKRGADLAKHAILSADPSPTGIEETWLRKLAPDARVAFVSNITIAVVEAALTGSGLAILPRWLGDRDARLVRVPMPDEPTMTIWLTVHKDLRSTRRVRAVLDFLRAEIEADRAMLLGEGARDR